MITGNVLVGSVLSFFASQQARFDHATDVAIGDHFPERLYEGGLMQDGRAVLVVRHGWVSLPLVVADEQIGWIT